MNHLPDLLDKIISDKNLHAKWLNTLSLMENTGAKKIVLSEDGESVSMSILKHAAEEARHAFFLKKQISKLGDEDLCPTYHPDYLLAALDSKQYLYRLDVATCRYLKSQNPSIEPQELKYLAYLLVTYLIEVRADELYTVYQKKLDAHHSPVNVKSIIAEEEGHLNEMISSLSASLPNWQGITEHLLQTESQIFKNWINSIISA